MGRKAGRVQSNQGPRSIVVETEIAVSFDEADV
jgi:hypothetical protein